MVVAGLFCVVVMALLVFVVGMRRRSRIVINGVRRLALATKRFPLKTAGATGASVSVVRHIGRSSGRGFHPPIQPVVTAEGFLVALPYGSNSHWVRAVLARGNATIRHDGTAYRVDHPEVVSLDKVADQFSTKERRTHRLFGVTECLMLRRTVADQTVAHVAGSAES
ncbi:MAG: nitroreductase family deazaflavin-dependent oxidoreductase [Pseudonocardiales bacterium]|nr:MAG: nitroreductase family deazaflavin-dependent oxidoreductase [Pseudonocardiales bacterium]